nr:hypothetical protein [Bacilli bacterium]
MNPQTAYVLSITQQGNEVTVSIYDDHGRVTAYESRDVDVPVTELPDVLLSTVLTLIHGSLRHAGLVPSDLAALGMAASTYSIVVWDSISGRPLGLIQTPMSFASMSLSLRADYLLQQAKHLGVGDEVSMANARFGGVHSWILWTLSQGKTYCIDEANDLVLLYDVNEEKVSEEGLMTPFLKAVFPKIVREPGEIGTISAVYLEGCQIPFCAITSLPNAGLIGSGILSSGKAFVAYGDDGFVVTRSKETPEKTPAMITFRKSYIGSYYEDTGLLLSRFSYAQTLLSWLDSVHKEFAVVPETPLGLMTEPSLVVAPVIDHVEEKASIIGLDAQTSLFSIRVAALRSMSYRVAESLLHMQAVTKQPIDTLHTERFGHALPALFWFQAGVTSIAVHERERDSYARGTAILAGVGAKLWTLSIGVKHFEEHVSVTRYEIPEGSARMKEQFRRWQQIWSHGSSD